MSDTISPLVMIPVARIDPHPHNPRRDLGDLGDLVKSIKAQGIRQNLLVVEKPRACRVCGCTNDPCEVEGSLDGCWAIQHDLCSQCEGRAEEVEEDTPWYTVVIGHRRLAAAVQAGLTEVPASIADLTDAQQLELMLMENVQRTDLTPIEEAEGLQGLLDLGVTQAGIAKATGISVKVVKGRLQLLTLPETAQAKIHAGQATLLDAVKLEDFADDPETLERLAGKLGTVDYGRLVQEAKNAQKLRAEQKPIVDALVALGVTEGTSSYPIGHQYAARIDTVEQVADAAPGEGWLFIRNTWSAAVNLYKPHTASAVEDDPDDRAALEAQWAAEREAREAAAAQAKAAYEVRDQWVKEFTTSARPTAKETAAILAASAGVVLLAYLPTSKLGAWLGLNDHDQYSDLKVRAAFTTWQQGKAPAMALVLYLHLVAGPWLNTSDAAPVLDALEACGYVVSDVERERAHGAQETDDDESEDDDGDE